MSAATGGFDAVVQLDERALQRIFTAMHQAGPFEHAVTHTVADRRVELLVNAPVIALDPTPGTAGVVKATAKSRVLYHDRPIADPADLGLSAACDLTVRASLSIPGGDPAPVGPDTFLVDDWQQTGAGDVLVHGLAAADEAQVRASVLDYVCAQHGNYPLDFLSGSGVTATGARVIARGSGQPPVLAVGANLSPGVKGSSTALTTSLCQQDWAFAVAAEFLVQQVTDRLAAELGGLPPPYGPAPVLIADDGSSKVWLDSFTVTPTSGAIVVTGAVRQVSGGLFGTVSATWTSVVTLALGANQEVTATATEPTVQLNEWYAIVGNWLSGGRLERAVREAVQAQLAGGLAGAGASHLFGDVVERLSAAGRALQVPITVRAAGIEVRPDAVVVHGTVTIAGSPPPPRARVVVFQGATPTSLVFHAGGSWSPGGEIGGVLWDFGDGTTQQGSGTSAVLVSGHTYAPGQYAACVTVTDMQGRTAQSCVGVQPGVLVLEQVGPGTQIWEFCKADPKMTFRVTSSGAPIPQASVTVAGTGWQVVATTDLAGLASVTLNPGLVETAGIPLPKPSAYHLGAVRVTAAKSGWQPRQSQLWMVDCNAVIAAVLAAKAHREEILDRLAGYAALRELVEKFGKKRPKFPIPLGPIALEQPPGVKVLQHIERAVEVLTLLEDLLQEGTDVLPVSTVFGIKPDNPETTALLDRRFGELWSEIDQAASMYNERYGNPHDKPPPH
jgi:PKD domain